MKKRIALVLAVMLLVPAAQAFAAEHSEQTVTVKGKSMMHFVVNGKEYAPPADQTGGFIYVKDGNGYTYVPLRFVGNILMKKVMWDGAARKVTIADPQEADLPELEAYLSGHAVQNSVIEPIGQVAEEELRASVIDIAYVFKGREVQPDSKTPGLMINNSIYLPLRFVYSSLGYEAQWDPVTYTVSTDTVYGDIVNAYEARIEALQNEVLDDANAIMNEMGLSIMQVLNGELTEEQKAELREKGEPMVEEAKAELNALLDELTGELENNGYTTEIVDDYREQYEKLEQTARKYLGA